ncbi:MAG: GAF domain-containing protein [Anaerolineales bacterium]|nr:MAG: GAF domain-containing protein [Anaerolineales bacterium]
MSDRNLLWEDKDRPGTLRFGGARMALLDIESGFWALRRQMEALVGRSLTDAVLQQAGASGGASFARGFVPLPAKDGTQAFRECVAAYQAAGFGRFEITRLEWPIGSAIVRAHDAFEAWMVQQHGQEPRTPVCAYTAGVLVGFARAITGQRDVVCLERQCQAQGAEACLFELLPQKDADQQPVASLDADPLLSHSLNLLEILFGQTPMAIAVFDRDARLRRFNSTWVDRLAKHSPSAARQVTTGVSLFDVVPGVEESYNPILTRLAAGETVRANAFRWQTGGIVSYRDAVFAPLVQDGEAVGFVEVSTDATERVLAQQTLEQRVQERTRELRALYDVLSAASASLELETVLQRSLDAVLDVMRCNVGAVHLLEENGHLLNLAAGRGIASEFRSQISSVPVDSALAGTVIQRGEPTLVRDIASSPLPLLSIPAAPDQIYLGVPLRSRGRTLGVLSVLGEAGRHFAEEEVALLIHIADEVGIAVENAQLYRQAEQLAVMRERQRLARELHDSVTQALYSLTLLSEAARRMAGSGELQQAQEPLYRLNAISQQALKEMRLLVFELRPLVLKREGLVGALQHRLDAVEGRAGVEARLLVHGEVKLPSEVEEDLYRIAQEALNNALKHAAASAVTVTIRAEDKAVEIEVVDDGTGFDPQTANTGAGMGLITMRERAEKMGAWLQVESTPGQGTTVRVSRKGDD